MGLQNCKLVVKKPNLNRKTKAKLITCKKLNLNRKTGAVKL